MNERKVIHIYNRAYDAYFPSPNSEYYYLAGWSSAVARQTAKYTNGYIIENWRPERDVNKPTVREVQGVVCRLFPSIPITHFGDWSPSMLKELVAQAKRYEILIHHSSIHSNSLRCIALLLRNTPIVAQHHGDSPPLVRFRRNRKLRSYVSYLIETKILKDIDHFFVLRKSEMDYLSRFVQKPCISLQTMGVDFDKFKPIDKIAVRRKLNLPENKKMVLYVGHYYRLKGVDIILRTYKELQQRYNIELILAGGSPTDQLHREVRSSGARFFGMLPHNELPLYYSAADVYLLPAFSPSYWGIDVTTIESLACGTPIVSTTLKDFPTEEWRKLGIPPEDEKDVAGCVSAILDNPNQYRNCREVARKYYDWNNIIRWTVKIYDELFNEYYGQA